MSAIPSLLRVMTLRDAEAIVLEAGRVPALRRRGQVEALAMPALEAALLEAFAAPLLVGRTLDDGPTSVLYEDPDGTRYQVTLERTSGGLRIVARKGPRPAPTAATPASRVPTPAPTTAPAEEPVAISGGRAGALARLGHLLGYPVSVARERGASDVLVSTGQAVRLRIDGRLEQLEAGIDDAELAACVAALGTNSDHALEIEGTRLRINAFDHLHGVGVVARLISDRVPTLADLALPPELGAVLEQRDGLVLVCGPTGSGKSTTLAALIDLLDQRRPAHVITLEDPIEYRFRARRCLIHQRELGTHVPSVAAGVTAALREAPDVILLGELRDRDTIAAALTAAETGHLVLATLHAPSAAGAIDRMIDAFPDGQQRQVRWQLAGVLRTVITQYLLPRRDGGRAAAVELVPVTPAVANIIRKGDLHTLPTAINTGRDAGMLPLERSLARMLDAGTVAPAVVRTIAADHDLLTALAGKLR